MTQTAVLTTFKEPDLLLSDVPSADRSLEVPYLKGDWPHFPWQDAALVRLDQQWNGQPAAPGHQATVQLAWTDEFLALRFDCQQREDPFVFSPPNRHQKTLDLPERDVLEVFLTPCSWWDSRYFEVEVSPNGGWLDVAIEWNQNQPLKRDWSWSSGLRSSLTPWKAEGFSVSFALPWQNLGASPHQERQWRANLFRCAGRGQERGFLSWQPTHTPTPSFHVPETFGWLEFKH